MTGTPFVYWAGAVAIDGRAVLIAGEPGSGKSTLALTLIDRGARLIGDDAVTLSEQAGTLHAAPPPNVAGLLEIRHVGLVRFAPVEAQVALHITLAPDPPRLPEDTQVTIAGQAVRALHLPPRDPANALRCEHALREAAYGSDA